jgi:hypothetical protein
MNPARTHTAVLEPGLDLTPALDAVQTDGAAFIERALTDSFLHELTATGTSRSAVSRRLVTATAERLDQLLHRPLDDSGGWWSSWTASRWASTCWSARSE